jgi:hypothetical protein
LGVAIALVGAGVHMAGDGVLAFSTALTALSVSGVAATAAIVAMVKGIIGLIPTAMAALAAGIIAFASVISTGGPAITKALVTVLNSLITAITTLAPKIVGALLSLILMLVQKMESSVPQMVSSGLRMLTGILQGIANNIGKVVTTATSVVVNFINGIANNLPRVIQSGVNLVLSFINGVANAIRSNSRALGAAGANLGTAIVEGMANAIAGGIGVITSAARRLASNALNAAKGALGIHSPSTAFYDVGKQSVQGAANAVEDYSDVLSKSTAGMGKDAILSFRKSIAGMSDIITAPVDFAPKITPVLDLSNVKKNSAMISSMLETTPITVEAAYISASTASAGYEANKAAAAAVTAGDTITEEVTFIQNNTSPKALSDAEIYRQTKSQLSRAKGVLIG